MYYDFSVRRLILSLVIYYTIKHVTNTFDGSPLY